MVITCVQQEQEGGHRLCENDKGGQELKNTEKHCIRAYGPILKAAFSKWPLSQNNCPPLHYTTSGLVVLIVAG